MASSGGGGGGTSLGGRRPDGKPLWKAANDPRSGRTYYYNTLTRETTWTKPMELSSPEERRVREEQNAKKMDFFREMEENMRRNMAKGLLSHDIDLRAGAKDRSARAAAADKAASDDPKEVPLALLKDQSKESDEIPTRIVRTISTVDDLMLEQAKRSESKVGSPSAHLDDLGIHADAAAESKESLEEGKQSLEEPAELVRPKVARRNSTSTIFVDSTMTVPDKEATIKCVCTVIRAHLLEASDDAPTHQLAHVFVDYQGPAEDKSRPPRIPSLRELTNFFREIYMASQMETECIIMALIYMERLSKETQGGIQVRADNWKSLLVSSMIMASKVWDDLSMWNSDFSQVCPSFTLKRINQLELTMLDVLGYNVKVSASDYAKYYFHLRSYCVRLGLTHDLWSLEPLNLAGAKKLETLSEEYEQASQATATMKRRCVSMPSSLLSDIRDTLGTPEPESASIEQIVHMRIVEAGETTPTHTGPPQHQVSPAKAALAAEEDAEAQAK